MIIPLQAYLVQNHCNTGICNHLISLPIYLFNIRAACTWMILLSLCTDSLLGFKSTLLTCFGIAFMSAFNTCYKDGRPFWDIAEIDSFGHCYFDFASPDQTMFVLTFFYGYNLMMYRYKFSIKTNTIWNYCLVFLYAVLMIM